MELNRVKLNTVSLNSVCLNTVGACDKGKGGTPPPPTEVKDALLLESGGALLLDNGTYIMLEGGQPADGIKGVRKNPTIDKSYWDF